VVSELVMISRFTAGRVELSLGPTTLEDVIEKALGKYREACQQRSITLEYLHTDEYIKLHADGTLLVSTIASILSNAIKYTPDGGTVTVEVEDMGDQVQVAIRDSGIGIDPADQAQIFDRFYTADDTQLHSTSKTAFRGGGLGVGLAISKAVIEQHGGKIWVESEARDEEALPGSTFFIHLPKVCNTTKHV